MSHAKYRTEKNCLNCGTIVERKFCPECGQANIEVRDNFFSMVGHFLADYFHYDSKFFRSLTSLFVRPGFLTKEYWEGKRVRYIHPLRLFFFITIMFVIVNAYFYNRFGEEMKHSMVRPDRDISRFSDEQLATMHDSARVYFRKDSITVKELKALKTKGERQVGKLKAGIDVVFKNLKYVTFLLLPIYALLFKLLYIRRKSFYVDHIVYTLHLQSFGYCIFSVLLILPFLSPIPVRLVMPLALSFIFIYLLLSLRYLYHQPWWKTFLKSAVATFLLFFVTVLGIVIIAGLDAVYMQ